jgi:hypothetical protein
MFICSCYNVGRRLGNPANTAPLPHVPPSRTRNPHPRTIYRFSKDLVPWRPLAEFNIAECLLGRYVPQLLVKSLMIGFPRLGGTNRCGNA